MLENKFYLIPAIFYFPGRVGGWVVGWLGGEELKLKLTQFQFQLKLPVWTELGKSDNKFCIFKDVPEKQNYCHDLISAGSWIVLSQ